MDAESDEDRSMVRAGHAPSSAGSGTQLGALFIAPATRDQHRSGVATLCRSTGLGLHGKRPPRMNRPLGQVN